MKCLVVHTGLPEEQLVVAWIRTRETLPRFDEVESHCISRNRERHQEELLRVKIEPADHIVLLGGYASPDTLKEFVRRNVGVLVFRVTWDRVEEVEHVRVLDLDSVFDGAPDWTKALSRPTKTGFPHDLHRGLIHDAQTQKVSLDAVYTELFQLFWEGREDDLLSKLERSTNIGCNIVSHDNKIAEEVVKSRSLHFEIAAGMKCVLVVGPYSPVQPYFDAALNATPDTRFGIVLRYSVRDDATYVSFRCRDEDEDARLRLAFVEREPFNGGGQPGLKGCNFKGFKSPSEIIDMIKSAN